MVNETKNVVVFGGNGRIGSELCDNLSKHSHNIVSVDVSNKTTQQQKKYHKQRFNITLKSASRNDVLEACNEVLAKVDHIDALVFCFRPFFKNQSLDDIPQELSEQFSNYFNTCLYSISSFRDVLAERNGCIIEVNSTNSKSISSQPLGYHVVKAASLQLFVYLSNLFREEGIYCYNVALGVIEMKHNSNLKVEKLKKDFMKKVAPSGDTVSINELSDVVNFLVKGRAKSLSGSTINLDGGLQTVDQLEAWQRACR